MTDGGEVTRDRFLNGRLTILQPRTGYRAATDPVLLAAAIAAEPGENVLELGCGVGVASLCLAARLPGLALTGVELQPAYAALARQNAEANGIRFEIVEDTLTGPAIRSRRFDQVMANPPYFAPGAGTPARDAGRETAFREDVPLASWIDIALRRTRDGGTVTLIHLAERLPDILAHLGPRAGDIAVLPVAPRAGRPASRIILRARKGSRAPFRLLAPFVLHDGDRHLVDGDDYTTAARSVLRDGVALPGFS